jgi:polysaccharide biosynthesis protein PslH
MKILQLYYKIPFPQHDGGAISQYNSSLGLLDCGVDLRILAMDQSQSNGDPEMIPEEFLARTRLKSIRIDNRIRPIGAIAQLFSRNTYFVERFRSEEFGAMLKEILLAETFDVIQLEHLYLCLYLPLIRAHSKAQVVLRPQNVEHQIWQRYGRGTGNPLKRWYLESETRKLRAFEINASQHVDGVMPLSDRDADWFRKVAPAIPVHVIPIGMELSSFSPSQPFNGTPSVYHLGSMDWMPNIEGLTWFVKEVVPVLKKQYPTLRLYLAGKKMPGWFFAQADDQLFVEGMVPDASLYQHDKAIMVVPLWSGSGIRVKIIEGMAMGKAIVSTSVGAEGLPVEDGRHLLLADSSEAFVAQIGRCLESESLCRALGTEARKLAEEKFDFRMTGSAMMTFFAQIVQNKTT